MTISIHRVTARNWREIVALQPLPEQKPYIEPNGTSLLEAFYDRSLRWQCYGLYENEVPAGFMMFGARTLWRQDIWIDRFMLDAAFQGQGKSSRFLGACVDLISRQCLVKRINASVVPGNTAGKRLFEQQGFVDTGQLDTRFNEQIYVLDLT